MRLVWPAVVLSNGREALFEGRRAHARALGRVRIGRVATEEWLHDILEHAKRRACVLHDVRPLARGSRMQCGAQVAAQSELPIQLGLADGRAKRRQRVAELRPSSIRALTRSDEL